MDMILNLEDEHLKQELIALGVNLATNARNAQLMIENNHLQNLIQKAFRNQDALIMKMIRNISQHDSVKENFVVSCYYYYYYISYITTLQMQILFKLIYKYVQEFVGDFAMAVNQSDSEDFVIEVVGILGNLELSDLDYSQILQRCNLIPWIRNNLVPGTNRNKICMYILNTKII